MRGLLVLSSVISISMQQGCAMSRRPPRPSLQIQPEMGGAASGGDRWAQAGSGLGRDTRAATANWGLVYLRMSAQHL